MQIHQHLKNASQQLESISDSPRLDAEVLLAFNLQKSRTWLVTWPDKTLSDTEINLFQKLMQRRINGEPIAHITGHREFWSLDLLVNQHTLIPRPETELMIETILQLYPQEKLNLLDLGTGSGAIALALASEQGQWSITATDQSSEALTLAKKNAQQLKLEQIQFLQSDWFAALKQQNFNIIASNPPYIPDADPHLSQGDVRFEPRSALASGNDGLDDIRHITQHAQQHLQSEGMLIIEHGFDQKREMMAIFEQNNFINILQINDLADNPRLTYGFKP